MSLQWRTCLAFIAVAWIPLAAAAQEEVEVIVENTTSVVNGETKDIPTLIAHPGSDGISFAEAFRAANGTVGKKVITFSEALINKTIEMTTGPDDRRLFVFDVPDITINGDLDRNGTPDVTLAAVRGATMVFVIRFSRSTIQGLNIITGFDGAPITFACLDFSCDDHVLRGVRIVNNDIINLNGPAIDLSPGPPRLGMIPYLTDLLYEDLKIEGNRISSTGTGISMALGVQGISTATARAISISRNTINAPNAIRITAAEGASPPSFSEGNVIENLTIDQNTIEGAGTGISVFAANSGNSSNRISGLQITANQIHAANGIEVAAARDGKPQRSGSGNVVENVTIASNKITAGARGIVVSGADVPGGDTSSAGFDSNRVQHVAIRENTISGYSDAGIRLWGGLASNGAVTSNSITDAAIASNILTAGAAQAVGIAIVGGETRGGSARKNFIRTLSVSGNRATGHTTGVLFVGGSGSQAVSNSIEVLHFSGNDLPGVSAVENQSGASGNAVRFARRRAVR